MFIVLVAGYPADAQGTHSMIAASAWAPAFNAVANWVLMYPLRLGSHGSGLEYGAHERSPGATLGRIIARAARRGCNLKPSTYGLFASAAGDPLLIRSDHAARHSLAT